MKVHASLRSLTFGLSLFVTVLGACASDQVIAWEEPTDAGTSSPIPDSGRPTEETGATCGDGTVDPGEECDDGNRKAGDGCSATCTSEDGAASACPGTPITLSATGDTRKATVTGDTSLSVPSMESFTCGGGAGKDIVYSLTSDVAGRAVLHLSAQWAALLSVRKNCAAAATETSCKALPAGGGQTDLAVPLAAGETIYVIVDGAGGQSGPFSLDVTISAAYCGDGLAMYPEQCDDGNTASGDGCSETCKLEGADPGAGNCPGIAYTFVGNPNAPRTIELAGDVSLLASTMGAFGCGSIAGGKDQAYEIRPTIDGALTAVLYADYPEAALHVRRECSLSATEVDCHMEPTGPVRVTFPVSANQAYTIFVDSKSGAAFATGGTYRMELTLSPATCGNGVIEQPETCDDGNTTAGDGCSATCTLEPMPAEIDACPGATIAFVGDQTTGPLSYRTTASTAPLGAMVRSCATGNARKDAVYQFVPPFNGYLTARVKAGFNVTLDLRSNCLPQDSTTTTGSISCGNADGGNGPETVRGAVDAGKTYYIVVDGPLQAGNLEGPFTLDLQIEKSICGNGRIEGGEECDDGNLNDGDTCSGICVIEPLGNPTRDTCDQAETLSLTLDAATASYKTRVTGGNWNLTSQGSFASPCGATVGRDAFFKVVPPVDGVLVVNVDATYNVTPGLREACPPSTGSAFLICSNRTSGAGGEYFSYPVKKDKPYWIIVDAANATTDRGAFTLDVSLKEQDCGDGIVGGTEQCDDGNLVGGDGCSPTCTVEPLAGVNTCPGYGIALTGTGNAVRKAVVTLSTADLSATYAGSCGGSSRDGVIAVTSDVTGTMQAQLDGVWASVLYAREACTVSSTELGCSAFDSASPNRTLRDLSFGVVAGVPTYLFVDGLGGATGPGTLYITVTP
jgi:cysteine-rich repeat protein